MRKSAHRAPLARITLRAHPPAPARLELVEQPLPGRLVRTVLSLVVCWGAIPLLIWIPPHYPWVLAAFVSGLYLAWKFWTGKYRVRSFVGSCPRCGRYLIIRSGTRIDLPYTLTCFSCHWEPKLEINSSAAPVAAPRAFAIEHWRGDCVGSWLPRRWGDRLVLTCQSCGASHPATPRTMHAADEENESGRLLMRLTTEGRLLN